MPHKVTFDIPEHDLGTTPADFHVYRGTHLIGQLKVGRGGLRWFDGHSKTPVKTMTWSKFIALVHESKHPKPHKTKQHK